MPDSKMANHDSQRLDSVYLNARREAVEILIVWALAMSWTVGYCAAFGYQQSVEDVGLVFGIPDWVFWGIAVPWLVASAFTICFSLVRMKHDPLGEKESPTDPRERTGDKEE